MIPGLLTVNISQADTFNMTTFEQTKSAQKDQYQTFESPRSPDYQTVEYTQREAFQTRQINHEEQPAHSMRRSSTVKIKFNDLNIQEENMIPSEFRNHFFSNYESNTMFIEESRRQQSKYELATHEETNQLDQSEEESSLEAEQHYSVIPEQHQLPRLDERYLEINNNGLTSEYLATSPRNAPFTFNTEGNSDQHI